jgi:hypothetical protein
MFQTCPICHGSGQVWPSVGYAQQCHVCLGRMIIDNVTGKPPESEAETRERIKEQMKGVTAKGD